MMNEEVRSIMSTDVVVVRPHFTVREVTELMTRRRLQQLPVIDAQGRLVGIVTSYDLWKACSAGDPQSVTIARVMNRGVVTLAPKDKVGTAAELFMDRRFKTLPVVNLEGKLKGVVTAFDLIRYSLKKEYPQPILYREVLM